MHLQFLWDEEKTRKLFRTHLILFTVGGVVATIYSLLLPQATHYRLPIILIPTLFTLSCSFYLFALDKPKPFIRFLLFTLEGQLAASIFMALTGGFLGIVQFAPYMFLLFSVFELGTDATTILGGFSVLTFLGILIFSLATHQGADVLQNFFYYCGSYILIVVIERNLGKELSVQFEAKKQLEQVDDLKNQFITLASHYLRTPLMEIKGVSYQMKSPQLEKSVKELELVTEKLLTISSFEKGQAKVTPLPGDLLLLLKNITSDFQAEAQEKKVTLGFQTSLQELRMGFDQAKLNEVFENLVDNAIKYNRPNGQVVVTLEDLGKEAIVRVSDNGLGIDKESLNHLFTTFNRGGMENTLDMTNPGLGLSLYLTKLIIEAHHGTISVQSNLNQGSVFTVILPKLAVDMPTATAPKMITPESFAQAHS